MTMIFESKDDFIKWLEMQAVALSNAAKSQSLANLIRDNTIQFRFIKANADGL